jgi:hypothetical protein
MQNELLSKEGTVTEIVDTVVVDKRGDEHPIKTVTRKRASERFIEKLLETGEEDKKSGDLIINFNVLEEEVAKKVKDDGK